MSWKQLNDANVSIPYVGGWCEGFVEGAWGQATLPTPANPTTSGIYGSAIEAWNAEPNKHFDLPPVGKTVPVYFSLGNVWQGHVAISLDDGLIASSTQGGYHDKPYFHNNLDNLIWVYGQYNGGCTYLGWGEHVGKVQVVKWEEPVVAPKTITILQTIYDDLVWWKARGVTLTAQAKTLNANIVTLTKNVADLTTKLNTANAEIARLNALPPKEVIKEVIKEVEKIVIKEVPIGFDQLSLGELLSEAFKKLFHIK